MMLRFFQGGAKWRTLSASFSTQLPGHFREHVGRGRGKILTVLGGVHGNELLGIQAVGWLNDLLDNTPDHVKKNMNGTLYTGFGNPEAIKVGKRATAPETDLNRCFELNAEPGCSSYEQLRADEIKPILSKTDLLIDIHATNKPSNPFLRVAGEYTPAHQEFVSKYFSSIDLLLDRNFLVGCGKRATTDEFVGSFGGLGICYETGQAGDLSRLSTVKKELRAVLSAELGLVLPEETLPEEGGSDRTTQAIFELEEFVALEEENGFAWADGVGGYNFQEVKAGNTIGFAGPGAPVSRGYDCRLVFPKVQELFVVNKPVVWLAREKAPANSCQYSFGDLLDAAKAGCGDHYITMELEDLYKMSQEERNNVVKDMCLRCKPNPWQWKDLVGSDGVVYTSFSPESQQSQPNGALPGGPKSLSSAAHPAGGNRSEDDTNQFGAAFARRLNDSILRYPLETCGTMVVLELGLVYGSFMGIKLLGLDFPAEFAFAFALSRVIKRFRFPLEVFAAAGVKNLFPALSTVRIMDLFAFSKRDMDQLFGDKANSNPVVKYGAKAATFVTDTMNQYGLCFFVASRFVGVGIVFCLYEAILYGVDISPMIEYLGAESVGDVLGDWAGAVVLSSSMYPATIYSVSHLAPVVGEQMQKKRG